MSSLDEKKTDATTTKKKCRAKMMYKSTKAGTTREKADGVFTVAYGSGGIEEMSTFLPKDNSMVLWGLLDFQIGSGKYARQKCIRMHLNGDKCKNIKKANINANRKKVEKVMGSINGDFRIEEQKECHVESVLEKVGKFFSVDHGDGKTPKRSIKALKEDYDKQIKMDKAKDLAEQTRKTAKDFDRTFKNKEILNYIHKDGPFNWALFRPNKKNFSTTELKNASLNKIAEFVNAGSMSINEMMKEVKNKDVLGGLIRMGFGQGKFKRTKYISLWWSGEKVGAVTRGTLNAKQHRLLELLRPWAFQFTAQKKETLTVTNLVDIVHKKLVVDGATKSGEDIFSEEAFYDALGEEIKNSAAFFDDKTSGPRTYDLSPKKACKKLHDHDSGINWVLLGLKCNVTH